MADDRVARVWSFRRRERERREREREDFDAIYLLDLYVFSSSIFGLLWTLLCLNFILSVFLSIKLLVCLYFDLPFPPLICLVHLDSSSISSVLLVNASYFPRF